MLLRPWRNSAHNWKSFSQRPRKTCLYTPLHPEKKTIRASREMMKNVQGSSAGAGSGEFHVYKASRRREYERLKLLEDAMQKV